MRILDRPEPGRQFLEDRMRAGAHIEQNIKKFYGLAENENSDFRWIKTDLSYPSFDDFTFGYKSSIYSVLVQRVALNGHSYKIQDTGGRIDRLIHECRNNNLVPCIFPVLNENGRPMMPQSWNLINALTWKPADPMKQSSSELAEVSEWEFMNWAVQIVSDYLRNEGLKRLSYCDVLGITPQIWFEDEDGRECWIEVICAKYPNTGSEKHSDYSKWPTEVTSHKGFRAEVSFANAETLSGKIYRTQGADVNFKGIKQIHTP